MWLIPGCCEERLGYVMLTHQHDKHLIKDPMNGHEWEICSCGYSLDITEMTGKSA